MEKPQNKHFTLHFKPTGTKTKQMARLGTSLRGKRKQNKKIDDKMRKIISVY
jgi:hypothetical protein